MGRIAYWFVYYLTGVVCIGVPLVVMGILFAIATGMWAP
jgi:hypothetical protein